MKNQIFIACLFLACSYGINAQSIYTVDYESRADVKIYVVDYESRADLLVYKEDYESRADGNEGKWYFVDYESRAGWKNSSKKHLLY